MDAPRFRENCFCVGFIDGDFAFSKILASIVCVVVPVRGGFAGRALFAARKASEIALPATTSGRTPLSDTAAGVFTEIGKFIIKLIKIIRDVCKALNCAGV